MKVTRVFLISAAVSFAGCLADATDGETTSSTSPLTTDPASQMDYSSLCAAVEVYRPRTACTLHSASGGEPYTTMHCCPLGYALQGVWRYNSTYEDLYCRKVSYAQESVTNTDPRSDRDLCVWRTQARTFGNPPISMNSCSQGEYMIGVHQGQNKFACCPSGQAVTEFADGPGQALNHQTVNKQLVSEPSCNLQHSFLHTCGDWSGSMSRLLVGAHFGANVFGCTQ